MAILTCELFVTFHKVAFFLFFFLQMKISTCELHTVCDCFHMWIRISNGETKHGTQSFSDTIGYPHIWTKMLSCELHPFIYDWLFSHVDWKFHITCKLHIFTSYILFRHVAFLHTWITIYKSWWQVESTNIWVAHFHKFSHVNLNLNMWKWNNVRWTFPQVTGFFHTWSKISSCLMWTWISRLSQDILMCFSFHV